MEMSASITKLSAALAKALPKIEGATKDKTNPAFRSKYADLASISEAIAAPIAEHGLSYIQVAHERENAAAIETIILHESGEWMSAGIVAVPVTKHDAHGFGSALTYARRYSLAPAFGVVPEDDDGNAATKAAPAPRGSVAEFKNECFDKLPTAEKEPMRALAADVIALVDDSRSDEAYDLIEGRNFDDLRKPALWALLDSKTRTAIKKVGTDRRAA